MREDADRDVVLADIPAVFLGGTVAKRVSMPLVRGIATAVPAELGLLTRFNVGKLS